MHPEKSNKAGRHILGGTAKDDGLVSGSWGMERVVLSSSPWYPVAEHVGMVQPGEV